MIRNSVLNCCGCYLDSPLGSRPLRWATRQDDREPAYNELYLLT